MKQTNIFRYLLRGYFIIFTIITLATAFLNPSHAFTFREIMLIALFALIGDLPTFITFTNNELSDKARYLRRFIHFILLEAILLTFGNILGQVSGLSKNILFAFQILGIYILVSVINLLIDHKTASDINKQLENMRSDKENEPKN